MNKKIIKIKLKIRDKQNVKDLTSNQRRKDLIKEIEKAKTFDELKTALLVFLNLKKEKDEWKNFYI